MALRDSGAPVWTALCVAALCVMMPNGDRHVIIVYVNSDGTEAGRYTVDPWATRQQDCGRSNTLLLG